MHLLEKIPPHDLLLAGKPAALMPELACLKSAPAF
jgi:hypothetical protein